MKTFVKRTGPVDVEAVRAVEEHLRLAAARHTETPARLLIAAVRAWAFDDASAEESAKRLEAARLLDESLG